MKIIGIIGAMELEIETLKKNMQVTKMVTKAHMDFYEGILNDVNVVVVRSGVAKVNASICTQILCDDFHVTNIINTGIAGSLDANIDIGDIVISTDACYHDVDATVFGYAKGEVPQLGMLDFKADVRMVELAKTVCQQVNPDIHVFVGRIVSGDQFICEGEAKDQIAKEFEALGTEMEGAAIAHTAFLNDIPFVILRAISDKADNSAHMDYPEFEQKAAAHCAKLVEEFVSEI